MPPGASGLLHVGVNAVPTGPGSGVLSYVEALVSRLPAMYPDVKYTFFVRPIAVPQLVPGGSNATIVASPFGARSLPARMLWEQLALPWEVRRRRIDVLYHLAAYDLPLVPCPRITRIDNMAPFEPEAIALERSFRGRWRLRLLRLVGKVSSYTSSCTLVPMAFVAEELVQRHGLSALKTIGINRGVTPPLAGAEPESGPPEVPDDFILVVATLNRYKKLEQVIACYAALRSTRGKLAPLLIAGHAQDPEYRRELDDQVAKLGLKDRIRLLGNVPRRHLLQYMTQATVTVFPSIVETCALTLIEEMLVGSALVVAERSVMPRLCGDTVLYFDPDDDASLIEALARALDDETLRARLRHDARERASALDLDWEHALRHRQELFAALAHGEPPRALAG